MKDNKLQKELQENCKVSQEYVRSASSKARLIHKITLTVILLEFALIFIGGLIFAFTKNFIFIIIAPVIFILTIIIGANTNIIKCIFINILIGCSRRKVKEFATIVSSEIISRTVVNRELVKVLMEFKFEVDGVDYTGYKILNVKKICKSKEFMSDSLYEKRMSEFYNNLQEIGAKLNIEYIPDKKYCIIADSANCVFNYFIVKVLYLKDKTKI